MKNTRKKVLSVLLTLVLAAVILPMLFATPAHAADEVEVKTVDALQTAFNNGGTVGLYAYLYPTTTLTVPAGKTVTLNMNGFGIYGKGTGYVIEVKGNLTITNPKGWNGIIGRDNSVTGVSDSIIHVAPGATLTLQPNGSLGIHGADDNHNKARSGGGILVEGGTLNMYANTFIQHCDAVPNNTQYTGVGGGVHLKDYTTSDGTTIGSTFNMYGGTIRYCNATGGTDSAKYMGGGVYIATNSTFNMSGGTISNCQAGRYGGGVLAYGIANISGGTIKNCSTENYSGGGLHIATNTSIMTGGTIQNCTATDYGGGVSVYGGNLVMSGGTITGCKVTNTGGASGNGGSGGGMYVTRGTITMSGGTIENCSTTGGNNGGGGVLTGATGTFTMSDTALITDCKSQYGGGIDAWLGTVNLNGGTIQNCTADFSGGGVYANDEASFTLNGTTITGNKAVTYSGGALYCEGALTVTSATIGKNTAPNASGIYSKTADYGTNATYSIENTYVPAITITSTVTLDNGTGSSSVTATFAQSLPAVTAPTRTGYTFLGYFDATEGGTKYYNANGTSAKNWDKIVATTLYAQWRQHTTRCGITADWLAWTSANSLPTDKGHYYLSDDVTVSGDWTVASGKPIYLDLNGKAVNLNKHHIVVSGTFTLCDSDTATAHAGYVDSNGLWHLGTGSGTQKTINGGIITGGGYGPNGDEDKSANGGGVMVNGGGAFYMLGGTICGCQPTGTGSVQGSGGGVYVGGGTFTMSGGTIQNCLTAGRNNGGGGVMVNGDGAIFEMSGEAKITDCTSQFGGAVDVYKGTFAMKGGTIENCRAKMRDSFGGHGGAVYVNSDGIFTMSDGIIQNCSTIGNSTDNNTAQVHGGGACVYGTFTMSGGTIQNCSTPQTGNVGGGGVFIAGDNNKTNPSPEDGGTFTMSGTAKITGCVSEYGGGVDAYIGKFTMTGGTIENCTATQGAVYVRSGGKASFTMTGGTIQDNNATSGAGGICGGNSDSIISFTGGLVWNNKVNGTIDPPTSNINFTPTDKAETQYVITFDQQGGTGVMTSVWGISNRDMPDITLPTRTEYTFAGYYSGANGTGTKYYNADGTSAHILPIGNITLYAKWSKDQTLTYDQNGHVVTAVPDPVIMKYTEAAYAAAALTATGYEFTGWNTASNGTGAAYAAGAQIKAANVDPVAMTLYAQWQTSTYQITYKDKGNADFSGNFTNSSPTAHIYGKDTELAVPTKAGFIFGGWYTNPECTGTAVTILGATAYTDAIMLYANWLAPVSIDGLSLLLDGDIGLWFHVTVNDKALKTSGSYMTLTIGGKSSRTETVYLTETSTDASGRYLFAFDVNSIQLAEKVTATFYDANGTVYDSVSKSVEDYCGLITQQSTNANEKALVKALVNYGYYAQQALSKTNGWVIGTDYATSTNYGTPTTATDLTAYKPVITGSGTHVTGLNVSLLLDNKTTLCLYFTTSDKQAPMVTVDGETVSMDSMKQMSDGRWLVRISNIDALHLGDVHTVTADGRTIYLSALSYGSVIGGTENINAIRALADYYQAALTYAGKTVMTEATVETAEYTYTGHAITPPAVTVKAGETPLTEAQYTVTWSGNLTDAGTYTGVITSNDSNILGSLKVTFTITPKKITVPTEKIGLVYNGREQNGVTTGEEYTLTGNTATNAGDYTATATLNDTANTCWADDTTDAKSIKWRIAKATPTVASAISITYYTNGEYITVTGGAMNPAEGKYRFETAPIANGTATAIFTPNDTTNYDTVPVEVTVTLSGTAKTSAVKIPKT